MSSHADINIMLVLVIHKYWKVLSWLSSATFIRPGAAMTGSSLLAESPMLSQWGLCRSYLGFAMIVTIAVIPLNSAKLFLLSETKYFSNVKKT